MIAITVLAAAAPEAAAPTVFAVAVNQTGYVTDGAHNATVVTTATEPLNWKLIGADGRVVTTGRTGIFGFDPDAGQFLHTIEFSNAAGKVPPGASYRIEVGTVSSHPFTVDQRLYRPLAADALAFFYHQRASTPIAAEFVGARWARPTAHDPDRATCYGPKDFRGNVWGGCPYTLDASRGWYDAGDHGKYVVNGGIAVWTLLNYAEWFAGDPAIADGAARIPEAGNGVSDLLDEVRWQLDFLRAMQVPDGTVLTLPRGDQRDRPSNLRFSRVEAGGLVHHKLADERWTSLPMRPEDDPETRYLHYPSTAATLNFAAVMAQASRVYRAADPAFAAACLASARKAYAAAKAYPDLYAIDVTDGGSGAYGDETLADEFYWAEAELFAATGEAAFAKAMRASPHFLDLPLNGSGGRDIAWPAVEGLGTLSLLAAGRLTDADAATARAGLRQTAEALIGEMAESGYATPFRRAYNWGSNSDLANRAILLGTAHHLFGDAQYLDGVTAALDYLLGHNAIGQSYVSGYGEKAMAAPHHRFWAPTLDPRLPPPPPGVLAGGPNNGNPAEDVARALIAQKCPPQACYADDVHAFSLNEVAINWNAPLFWIAAARDRAAMAQ